MQRIGSHRIMDYSSIDHKIKSVCAYNAYGKALKISSIIFDELCSNIFSAATFYVRNNYKF